MRNCLPSFLLLVALVTPVGLTGQARSPDSGDRIRVWTQLPDGTTSRLQPVIGELALWRTDTVSLLTVEEPHARAIAAASVARLDISAGRPRGAGALRGAGIGLLAGSVTGMAIGLASGDDGFFSAEQKALALAVALGVPSTAIGAIAGAIMPRELWRSIPIPGR